MTPEQAQTHDEATRYWSNQGQHSGLREHDEFTVDLNNLKNNPVIGSTGLYADPDEVAAVERELAEEDNNA